jgi:hypothetical protein
VAKVFCFDHALCTSSSTAHPLPTRRTGFGPQKNGITFWVWMEAMMDWNEGVRAGANFEATNSKTDLAIRSKSLIIE